MTGALRTVEDYELFLYTLTERFSSLRRSHGHAGPARQLARAGGGELHFDHGIRVIVRERLVFDRLPVVIAGYAYEAW